MEAPEIAVRIYANDKFGTTHGKGLRHSAVFNAAADIKTPNAKYLLDFYTMDRWEHTAKSNTDMEALSIVRENIKPSAITDTLASWVVRYDPTTKTKTAVMGFATLDLSTNAVDLVVLDTELDLQQRWKLKAKSCKTRVGKNSPTLLATNAEDLALWG
jgi:hypothetical protein